MQCSPEEGERINSFALVSYVPDPLGAFLDQVRRDLVAECIARSHVTILPPRLLTAPPADASTSLHVQLQEFSPFTIELTDIELFEKTSVIYLGIGEGRRELIRMHDTLNDGVLWFDEPYYYHPHITLAQDFDRQQVERLFEWTRRRWAEYRGPRRMAVDVLTFVQNTLSNRWLDLEEFPLAKPVESWR